MEPDTEVRDRALEYALKYHGNRAAKGEDVVETAKSYYAFLMGWSDDPR